MSAVGLEFTTSGSSFGTCSSSAPFYLLWLRLVFVIVDDVDCWLVAASKSHRRKTVAADRVDVPSYVLKELMCYIDVNIVTKKSSLSFGGRRQGYRSVVVLREIESRM